MLEREYNKNKAKLIKNLKELNVPTESDVEEYIQSKVSQPKVIQPKMIQPMVIDNEQIKEYYNTK
jgi:hypothetical protein